MSQPLVLAIEPDLRQAAIVKRIVREKALAEIVVVDSRDAAIQAMRTSMPDVLLLSALLSPRDEDELIAHLKTLDNAGHLQTHTIPQLASSLDGGEERASRGLLSAFRRKKESALVAGCDPDLFAEEIGTYLRHAADKRRELQAIEFARPASRPTPVKPASTESSTVTAPEVDDSGAAPESAWSSPFEWKPASSSKRAARTREEKPAVHAAPPPPPPPPPPAAPDPVMESFAAAPVVEPVLKPLAEVESVLKPAAESVLKPAPVVTDPVVTEPVVVKPVAPVVQPEAPVVAKKTAKPAEAPRPKAVADRPAKLTRTQLQELLKARVSDERLGRDHLGPLSRWARSDAPRPTKGVAMTSDDVRALISSLAVPSSVASVTYPRGVRLRRVRVPLSSDQEGAVQASA